MAACTSWLWSEFPPPRSARLRSRFEQRLSEYAMFWENLERLCRQYGIDHQAAAGRIQDFVRDISDAADIIDTAESVRRVSGQRVALVAVCVRSCLESMRQNVVLETGRDERMRLSPCVPNLLELVQSLPNSCRNRSNLSTTTPCPRIGTSGPRGCVAVVDPTLGAPRRGVLLR